MNLEEALVKTAVVTGANGFVGSHLCELLKQEGYQVRCIIRSSSNTKWLDHQDLDLHRVGLTDVDAVASVLQGADYLFHLAGTTKSIDEKGFFDGNVETTRIVLEAALKAELKNIVVSSSLAASAPAKNLEPVTEETPSQPFSIYGRSKVAQEQLCKSYDDRLPVTIVRPPIIYGPRDTEVLLFFKMVNSSWVTQVGKAQKYLSAVYISDLVRGLKEAAESEKAVGETFFIGSEEHYSWRQFSEAIAFKLNKKVRYITIPLFVLKIVAFLSEMLDRLRNRPATLNREKAKEMAQEAWICSPAKAGKFFNYRQETSLEEGISSTIDWYKKENWL